MVVLARFNWYQSRCNTECQMGGTLHRRLDWKFDSCSTMGLAWRRKDRYSGSLYVLDWQR
jgi:hypothetical protein